MIKTNYSKYANKMSNLRKAGEMGTPARIDEEKVEQLNKEKEICLNCTKKKCRGTKKCFEKERNKYD